MVGVDTGRDQTLNQLGRATRELFSSVIKEFDNDPSRDASIGALLSAEADRFGLWAVSLGLFVPGHGSLDYRVREAENIRTMLQTFLETLYGSLVEVVEYFAPENTSETALDDSAVCLSDSDSDDGDDTGRDTASDMEMLLDGIRDPIDRLYKLSTWIRNPSSRFSSSKMLSHKQIDPETGADLLEAFSGFDLNYIESVFSQYRKSKDREESASDRAPDYDEKPRSHEESPSKDEILIDFPESFLVRRLALANGHRRQQFSYWRRHREKLALHTTGIDNHHHHSGHHHQVSKDVPAIPSHHEYTTQEAPVINPLSVTTATRLNIPQHVAIKDNLSVLSVSKYAPSNWRPGNEKLDFPPAPKHLPGEKFFECPYCFTLCPRSTLDEEAWKAHLIHDLRPYICTYEDCKNPNQLYDTRQDWLQHESSTHRKVFHCPKHPEQVFLSLKSYQEHIDDGHLSSNNNNIPTSLIIQSNESTLTVPDRPCPICLVSIETMDALQKHIALHLERFALFSLPRDVCCDDGNDIQSNNANGDWEGSRDEDFGENSTLSSAEMQNRADSEKEESRNIFDDLEFDRENPAKFQKAAKLAFEKYMPRVAAESTQEINQIIQDEIARNANIRIHKTENDDDYDPAIFSAVHQQYAPSNPGSGAAKQRAPGHKPHKDPYLEHNDSDEEEHEDHRHLAWNSEDDDEEFGIEESDNEESDNEESDNEGLSFGGSDDSELETRAPLTRSDTVKPNLSTDSKLFSDVLSSVSRPPNLSAHESSKRRSGNKLISTSPPAPQSPASPDYSPNNREQPSHLEPPGSNSSRKERDQQKHVKPALFGLTDIEIDRLTSATSTSSVTSPEPSNNNYETTPSAIKYGLIPPDYCTQKTVSGMNCNGRVTNGLCQSCGYGYAYVYKGPNQLTETDNESKKKEMGEKLYGDVPGSEEFASTSGNLIRRKITKHGNAATREVVHPCMETECNRVFARQENLRRHMRENHGVLDGIMGPSGSSINVPSQDLDVEDGVPDVRFRSAYETLKFQQFLQTVKKEYPGDHIYMCPTAGCERIYGHAERHGQLPPGSSFRAPCSYQDCGRAFNRPVARNAWTCLRIHIAQEHPDWFPNDTTGDGGWIELFEEPSRNLQAHPEPTIPRRVDDTITKHNKRPSPPSDSQPRTSVLGRITDINSTEWMNFDHLFLYADGRSCIRQILQVAWDAVHNPSIGSLTFICAADSIYQAVDEFFDEIVEIVYSPAKTRLYETDSERMQDFSQILHRAFYHGRPNLRELFDSFMEDVLSSNETCGILACGKGSAVLETLARASVENRGSNITIYANESKLVAEPTLSDSRPERSERQRLSNTRRQPSSGHKKPGPWK